MEYLDSQPTGHCVSVNKGVFFLRFKNESIRQSVDIYVNIHTQRQKNVVCET